MLPSGADTLAAAAIGARAGVLGEAAERLYEAFRQATDQRADEGSRLANAERPLLGSTSSAFLHRSSRPVVVVPQSG